jgi:hypothetical protein
MFATAEPGAAWPHNRSHKKAEGSADIAIRIGIDEGLTHHLAPERGCTSDALI